ncbi:olfactory receptor 7A17-like [Apodemus sylvaticus]|uniref:olfactory receptor 7A17-like n=1 Tax=Apodemus sylvaticus TaxID=10129 RepID=UPI002243A2B5|nr:olfactory receptor 7A17-like [Apodemus sylvaticus]
MDVKNYTKISQFLLLGISEDPRMQPVLFGLFLAMYLVTVLGNLLIILLTISDSHLHTPMYFFLSNLSLVDICFSSTTIPKMLVNLQSHCKLIMYKNCITQMLSFIFFSGLDIFLLTIMAYDRYVAICKPLHYTIVMNPRLCVLMVLVSWTVNILHVSSQGFMVLQLSFCAELKIYHFFCELNQILQLVCSDNFLKVLVMYLLPVLLAAGSLIAILCSYSEILSCIRAISSAQGKYKAFSTCASHLSVVSLFYCTGIGLYMSSVATENSQSTARASVLYSVVTPMLNPFIYCLRNKDIKNAVKKVLA